MPVQAQSSLRTVLGKVTRSLAAGEKAGHLLEAFANELFEDASYDDLAPFSADRLAAIASEAFEFLRQRQRGRSKVRLFNHAVNGSGTDRAYTVLEIANDDMPFLVESVLAELAERGIEVHLLLHPVLWVARDTRGRLENVLRDGAAIAEHGVRESFIHVHVDRVMGKSAMAEFEARLSKILDDVRTVVLDWSAMRGRVERAIAAYKSNPPPVSVDELTETIEFLEWLVQDHFTLLGIREFSFDGDATATQFREIEGSGLGVLRDPGVRVLRRGTELVTLSPEVRDFLMQPAPLIVTKANVKAHVHRRAYMDYIGVKQFDENGIVSGELRVVGLFTSVAYTRSARAIPFLRRKVDLVLARAGFDPSTHSGRALVNVLESFPRDELFQIDVDTLTATAVGILQLAERPRTRIFVRLDKFDRFASVLVFVPRDSYDTAVRIRIGNLLAAKFEGRVSAFYPAYPEGTLARVHFIIGHDGGPIPKVDLAELEQAVAAIARGWTDSLKSALEAECGPAEAHDRFEAFRAGFSPAYQDYYRPEEAVRDIAKLLELSDSGGLGIDLSLRVMGQDEDHDGAPDLHLKLFHRDQPIALSDRLPVLENMGFRAINERSYEIGSGTGRHAGEIWLHDIVLEADDDGRITDFERVGPLIEEGFRAVWNGEAENDGYNRLIRHVGVGWREVSVLRAVGRYLQQAGVPFSQDYMAATLTRHPAISARLLELCHIRFNPDRGIEPAAREERCAAVVGQINSDLDSVPALDEDRIIRHYVNVVTAALRTNYYQRGEDGSFRPAIAIKLRSAKIEGLAKPRPYAEIFVYSPRVEGIHLRGGPIARGGLRWSDRPHDFRTEVLGLVKAQQVKNAVIVPVGAKGGFVPKQLPRSGRREDLIAEGIACYKIFIGSLLDVTDNLVDDAVRPPRDVLRHDSDDPYLVVAADKGTATFSDIANSISVERGFWLGDAFASGGSAGYDHKKMGITARGAWEAVKRHFREIDRDIQSEPFTVVGVGDMSGDVFGNSMLLSRQTRLLAAFDHRDIFIDPDPDVAASFAERRRLFRLDRSSWRDYRPELISPGGGVFSRQEKSIRISKEIRALTGIEADRATPNELIRALLGADVDLLWFGGIGTYVRASDEADAEVGDRTNDPLRVVASDIAARVVGEGANLGLTQRARIEYAAAGGRINTDAIDNSAGVNTSDIEVNIKIALANAIKKAALEPGDRNKLLADMTGEVAALVLRNNYEQTLCLGLAVSRCGEDLDYQQRLMRELESRDLLDRAVESLPDDNQLAERRSEGRGLTRPELAVLLAYAKITLFDDILRTDLTDDAYLGRELINYFPAPMRERFAPAIAEHRLRREIIATRLANSILNRGGSTMVQRLRDETGAGVAEIVAAFALARDSYDIEALLDEIDALDNRVANRVQTAIYVDVQNLIRRQAVWFLRHVGHGSGLEPVVARFRDGIGLLDRVLDSVVTEELAAGLAARAAELAGSGVPRKLARRLAALPILRRGTDIVLVADATGRSVEQVARAFFRLGGVLGTDELLQRAETTPAPGYYDRLALNRVVEGITAAQRRLTTGALSTVNGKDPVGKWLDGHASAIDRARAAVSELAESGTLTLSKLSVASAYMHDLAEL